MILGWVVGDDDDGAVADKDTAVLIPVDEAEGTLDEVGHSGDGLEGAEVTV